MKNKHICVDMDICSDPIFVSDDGKEWLPGDLEDLCGVISLSLVDELLLYQDLWDLVQVEEYHSGNKLKVINFTAWTRDLASSLSQELSGDYSVYYYDPTLQKNVLVD